MMLTPQLKSLARAIRNRQEVIDCLEKDFAKKAAEFMREVLLQGLDLLAAKAQLKHGEWLPWLSAHFTKSHDTAMLYMRIASNSERVRNLEQAGGLRKALALLTMGDNERQERPATEPWPPHIQALSKFTRFSNFILRHPIAQWPESSAEQLRDDLLPIAKCLWPKYFEAEGAATAAEAPTPHPKASGQAAGPNR